jgi:hypothetical protein
MGVLRSFVDGAGVKVTTEWPDIYSIDSLDDLRDARSANRAIYLVEEGSLLGESAVQLWSIDGLDGMKQLGRYYSDSPEAFDERGLLKCLLVK